MCQNFELFSAFLGTHTLNQSPIQSPIQSSQIMQKLGRFAASPKVLEAESVRKQNSSQIERAINW